MDLPDYEERWRTTSEQVQSLMSVPPDDASLYRKAAFVVPHQHADLLAFADT
jgi:hypothetical protein